MSWILSESRFTTQALLDETAVLACMAYVDLNPIRAGMTDRPETSDYTSLQERLGIRPGGAANAKECEAKEPQAALMNFTGTINALTAPNVLPHSFTDYLELVDWTGRAMRDDKRGSIPAHLPPALQRLNIDPDQWLKAASGIEHHFCRAIGPIAKLEQFCQRLNKRWMHGMSSCRALYAAAAS